MPVERQYQLLALKNGFGSVFRCGSGCLHLSVGRVAIAMNEDEYYELVDMINTSAANFELRRGQPESDDASHAAE
jgi:hypothetical protein